MALAFKRAQYAPDGGPDALEREHALVSRGFHIALEGNYGRGELVELKARLEHRAVNVARVDAYIPRLPAEGVQQRLAGERAVGVEQGGEAPEQAVPVPIRGGDVVARAAARDQHALLRVQREAGGVEEAEEHIGVVKPLQGPVIAAPAARGEIVERFIELALPALTQQLLGARRGGDLLVAEPPAEAALLALAGRESYGALERVSGAAVGLGMPRAYLPVAHGREGQQREAGEELEDGPRVPEAVRDAPHAVYLLALVDGEPRAAPHAAQAVAEAQRFAPRVFNAQPPYKAALAHGREQRAGGLERAGAGAEFRHPEAAPRPAEILERAAAEERLNYRLAAAVELYEPLRGHVQHGKAPERGAFFVQVGQGDEFVACGYIPRGHRQTSQSDLIV